MSQTPVGDEQAEAEIIRFWGRGARGTTLSIQTALLLLGNDPKKRQSTCLVDLDFQHGACADYLDLEPRLDLNEIEPHPERLDRQLLEVMLAYHTSGLAVIAAPNRPAEMRTFDPDMVTRLLDLVSSHFKFVVIDMPRTWFSWTDCVLLGSNRLFVGQRDDGSGRETCQAPCRRHARAARRRRSRKSSSIASSSGCSDRGCGAAISCKHWARTFAAIPSNYRLVREAIDRGVPLEDVRGAIISRSS